MKGLSDYCALHFSRLKVMKKTVTDLNWRSALGSDHHRCNSASRLFLLSQPLPSSSSSSIHTQAGHEAVLVYLADLQFCHLKKSLSWMEKDGCTMLLEAIIQKRFPECLQFGQHKYSKTQIRKTQLAVSHSRLRHIFQITWGYTKGSVQSIIKNLPPGDSGEWLDSVQADWLKKFRSVLVPLQQGT